MYLNYVRFKILVFYFLRILSSKLLFRLNLALFFPVLREKQLLDFLYRFRPYQTNFQLIRLGEVGDGGYLIPNDLTGKLTCITAGVGKQIGFEYDLAQKGISCYMTDYSVEKTPLAHKNFFFLKKFIGTKNDDIHISFKDYLNEILKPNEDYILKIDIEGDELKVLPLFEEHDLARMRIIIIELHHFTNIITPMGYNLIEIIMNKIQKNHTIVHIHPNSYSPCIKFSKKIELYDLLEITFLRNDRITKKKEQLIFPHALDSITNNFFKSKLPQCFYKKLN
jgi:sRNA-binding regulator protein Hfq